MVVPHLTPGWALTVVSWWEMCSETSCCSWNQPACAAQSELLLCPPVAAVAVPVLHQQPDESAICATPRCFDFAKIRWPYLESSDDNYLHDSDIIRRAVLVVYRQQEEPRVGRGTQTADAETQRWEDA